MHEIERLEGAIAKLSTCRDWEERPIQKEILLRGERVYQWVQETTVLLTRQLRWLDTQLDSPTYEQRFNQWHELLKQYERACDALAVAESLKIGIAA